MAPDRAGKSMTAFDRLVEALEAHGRRVTGNGRKRMATCPAHDDGRASLSIGDGDGRALAWCFAGCPTDAVLEAVKLRYADLFDGGGPSTRPLDDDWAPWQRTCPCPPVMIFSYESAEGRLLYQVVRGRHKEFAQRHPDRASRSGWRWNLDGVQPVLFRLPRLLQAGDSDVIFLVEGERDALALEAAGEIATTCPGGARNPDQAGKRWLPGWSEPLRGRDVLIVADHDVPGRVHARYVAGELEGVTRFCWVIEAAQGKDARDHLAAGLGVTDFVWWTR
jgi:hypothetical protein